MSANHHIHLTTKITISINKKYIKDEKNLKILLLKEYRDDFDLVYKKDFEEDTVLVFALKKEYLKDVQSFILETLLMAREILDKYYEKKYYDKFIEWFKKLDIDANSLYEVQNKKNKELKEKLKGMEYNFFTNYTEVPDYAVYEGFPNDLKADNRRCTMVGFDIVYSYFGFLTTIEETVNFEKLKEQIQKESKYPILSKYIYHLGY